MSGGSARTRRSAASESAFVVGVSWVWVICMKEDCLGPCVHTQAPEDGADQEGGPGQGGVAEVGTLSESKSA
jgi:hypothetical protein